MGKINLSPTTFKIDWVNAKALISGFYKPGVGKLFQVIYPFSRVPAFPALITYDKSATRLPVSYIGANLNHPTDLPKLKYIADLVGVYSTRSDIKLWELLCNNGLFDVWLPIAPFKRFADIQSINDKIGLLRIYEIEEEFQATDLISQGGRNPYRIDNEKLFVTIKRPILSDNDFYTQQNLLENSIKDFYIGDKKLHITFDIPENKTTNTPKHISFQTTEKHFSTINICEYKMLKNMQINDLRQINLFAGLNNSGKSSVLEAVHLLCYQNDFDGYIELQRMRAKFHTTNDITLHFLKKHTSQNIDIKGVYADKEVSVKINKFEKTPEENSQHYVMSYKLSSKVADDKNGGGYDVTDLTTEVHLFGNNFAYKQSKMLFQISRNICKSDYYSPFTHQLREKMRNTHRQNVLRKSYPKIVEFIKEKVDTKITDIILTGEADNDVRFKVFHQDFTEAADLTEFGDGMQRMFAIALQFAAVENGVLLIDELENAIDYQHLNEFAGFIIELALLFNVQVFITSHSKECINAFFEYDKLNKISCYTLLKNSVRHFSGYDYEELIDVLNVDLRKVEE